MITYKQLFLKTFKISAVTFGGGYTIVPVMRDVFVNKNALILDEEMLNLIAIAQSAPGPIAVNTSILIGYKLKGLRGAVVSTFATVLPPLLIISVISFFYIQFQSNQVIQAALLGMRGSISAIMGYAVFSMGKNTLRNQPWFSAPLMIMIFLLGYFTPVPTIFLIIGSGLTGLIYFGFSKERLP
ncbi:MAG: chromate transporter [Firmicutes bacterium HGW-Firmicutes-20]|jgi:chromate transporter|nr:MAG: chromate transporter [Firmicutes bacterium HGW-Firmicutes-20]PKM69457.1 MAG: chromate transporter [Firmicutes bacterium HGW-Firmicutes-19]